MTRDRSWNYLRLFYVPWYEDALVVRIESGFDAFDLQDGQVLTVTTLLLVTFPALLFEDDDFVATLVRNDLGRNAGSLQNRSAYFHLTVVVDEKNVAELQLFALFAFHAVDDDFLVLGNLKLLAGNVDDSVHRIDN